MCRIPLLIEGSRFWAIDSEVAACVGSGGMAVEGTTGVNDSGADVEIAWGWSTHAARGTAVSISNPTMDTSLFSVAGNLTDRKIIALI